MFFIIVGLYVNYPYTLHVNDNLAYTDRESDEDSPKKPNNCSLYFNQQQQALIICFTVLILKSEKMGYYMHLGFIILIVSY